MNDGWWQLLVIVAAWVTCYGLDRLRRALIHGHQPDWANGVCIRCNRDV